MGNLLTTCVGEDEDKKYAKLFTERYKVRVGPMSSPLQPPAATGHTVVMLEPSMLLTHGVVVGGWSHCPPCAVHPSMQTPSTCGGVDLTPLRGATRVQVGVVAGTHKFSGLDAEVRVRPHAAGHRVIVLPSPTDVLGTPLAGLFRRACADYGGGHRTRGSKCTAGAQETRARPPQRPARGGVPPRDEPGAVNHVTLRDAANPLRLHHTRPIRRRVPPGSRRHRHPVALTLRGGGGDAGHARHRGGGGVQ